MILPPSATVADDGLPGVAVEVGPADGYHETACGSTNQSLELTEWGLPASWLPSHYVEYYEALKNLDGEAVC